VPLPVTEEREHIHTRTITINAYRRNDALMDVEGQIVDVKPFEHHMMDGVRKAGEPVHDLSIRITLDDTLTVQDAVASMDSTAHDLCPQATPNFKNIIGLQIAAGWNKKVKAAMSPGLGCTHIIEMLAQMASGAKQAMWSRKVGEAANFPSQENREMKFDLVNTCYPYRQNSPFIKEHFPSSYIATDAVVKNRA
jgi:hypothetical protein